MTTIAAAQPSTYHAPAERLPLAQLADAAKAIRGNPLLTKLLDAYPDLAMVLNAHRQIVHANRTLLSTLGVPPEALLGQRPGEAVGCVNADKMPGGCGTSESCRTCGAANAMLRCLDEREQVTNECQILVQTPNGPTALELGVTATPLTLDGGNYLVLVGRDLASAKRRAALERTFFHDALNLAGGIQAVVKLVIEEQPHDPQVYLQRLEAMTLQLVEQIRAQRELAQAESGELSPQPKRVVIRRILEDVRAAYEYHPVAAGRIIRCVPPVPPELEIQTDPVLLGRTLGNLVKNALEASSAGDAVTIHCELTGPRHVVFSVHNPTCMPRHVQLQVFHRSFSTKSGTGRGLGTFSVKLLTERYLGGNVDFASNPQQGTTFYVRLPRGELTAAPGRSTSIAEKSSQPLSNLRVLVADDDPDIRRFLEVALRKAGAKITVAEDGQAAIDAFTAHGPAPAFDVILLDLEMPRRTGYEALTALRAGGFTGPLIALSAHGAAADGPRCLAAGFTAYVEKPVERQTLIESVRRYAPTHTSQG